MDFSASAEDEFNRLVQQNEGINRHLKDKIISEGESTPPDPNEDVVFQFDKYLTLEAELIGETKIPLPEGESVDAWEFKETTGKVWLVPQYKELKAAFEALNATGNIGAYLYQITYEGEVNAGTDEQYYSFKVLRKLK